MSERTALAAQLLNSPDAEVILSGVGSALLACEAQLGRIATCEAQLARIAAALEAETREPSYLPPRQAPPEPEVVAGGNFGIDPETGGEAAMTCGAPLYRPEPPPRAWAAEGPPFKAQGSQPPREIEATCFLEAGHHGSHRSDKGHIWS